MPNSPKEYHLADLLTGESLGGFESLAGARDEARAIGLMRWVSSAATSGLRDMIRALMIK
jgi:hypothetical protein